MHPCLNVPFARGRPGGEEAVKFHGPFDTAGRLVVEVDGTGDGPFAGSAPTVAAIARQTLLAHVAAQSVST
jgi:hypothetical protein